MATRQLARQLGIIRSVSKPSPVGQSHNQRKLLEFPAVLLNTSNGEIETEFHMYVQPQEHPTLSEFCIELTGIKQDQVDEGVPLHISLSQFSKWIHKIQEEKKIVFGSTDAAPEKKLCAFVTWSDWDLGICLHYECKRKQLRKPNILNSWIDLRATYKSFYSRKPQGLNGALKDVGITFEGREHSGLHDSRNTARLAWKMICDGCVMKITKSLDKAPPVKNSLARFGGEKPAHDGPSGINPLVKASPLDESKKEVPPEIKRKEEDSAQETVRVALFENPPLASGKSRKTDQCGSTKQNLTSSIGRPHWPLINLQHPCYRPSGLQSWGDKGQLISNPSTPNRRLVLVPTTLSTVNFSETDIGTTPDCLSMLANWEDIAIIPEKDDDSDLECSPSKDNPPTKSAFMTEDGNKSMNRGDERRVDVPPSRELSKCVVYKSPNTTIYNAGRAPIRSSDASTFKLPVVTAEASSPNPPDGNLLAPSTEAIKRKPSSPKSWPPNKKAPFRIHEDGRPTSSSFPSPGANPCGVSPALLSSSGNFNPTFRVPETGRVTPPLCRCGRRARRLNVSNGGPNQGKAFYSCPVRKCERNTKGCNYFRWEHSLVKEKMGLPASTLGAGGLKPLKIQDHPSLGNVKPKFLNLRPSMRT
ncbi:ERI1 exoribonuclease 2 isoform X2 [Ahaetulla prasina]|uniref:ERI1 exoribonuclease 2 isoform X2 n=1 Tax=Ahaetulla prasina TaxID=499056 RepID=UPI00264976A8|nr:ERI1 exoribonuclease 2 isoform X2 [Ahaetulla prasina]